MHLELGERHYDLSTRSLVMGILNRTPDSFLRRGQLLGSGRVLLPGPNSWSATAPTCSTSAGSRPDPGPEVREAEELDRVVPAIAALHDRFDVPLSVDTWRAAVAAEAFRAGAVVGNDISGFADPGFLPAAAGAGAAVVATHIRLGPRVPDPNPHYDDVVEEVTRFLADRAEQARGGRHSRPAGSSWMPGWTWERRPLSRRPCCAPRTGWRPWVGRCCSRRPTRPSWACCSASTSADRAGATAAAHAIGVSLGCRILRAHDVRAARRVCDTLAAVMEAG